EGSPLMRLGLIAAGVVTLAAPAGGAYAQSPGALGVDTTHFDRAVRPQGDFFRFANGGWLRSTTIPEDRSTYGAFVELDDASQEALRAIVEEAAAGSHAAGSVEQKVGDFYASFMDSVAVERLGVEPLRGELDRLATLRGKDELPELFAHLARQGVRSPIGFSVSADARDATRYVAYASQAGLGLPDRDYYLGEDAKLEAARAAYVEYARTLLELAGERDPAAAAAAVFELETTL